MRYKFILLIATTFIGCTTIPDGYVKDSGGETIYKHVDSFQGATFYRHVNFFGLGSNYIEVYIAEVGNDKVLKYLMDYTGRAPIYIDKVFIINGNGNNRMELPIDPLKVNSSYSQAWFDENTGGDFPDAAGLIFYKILKAGNVKIRFSGRNGVFDTDFKEEFASANLEILERYFKAKGIKTKAFE